MTQPLDFSNTSHLRYNPLTQSHVLVSPHRAKRPWQGQVEKAVELPKVEYDPKCYLCPGNERMGGMKNDPYTDTFVFINDFPAVSKNTDSSSDSTGDSLLKSEPVAETHSDLFSAKAVSGECRVICFSPNHSLTLALLPPSSIEKVIHTWHQLYLEYFQMPSIKYIQLFENKGEMMGCSNPHPHGQCWALDHIPEEVQKEFIGLDQYNKKHDSCLLCDYAKTESMKKERIIYENELFVCLVPFWAVWPFETMILAKQHLNSLADFKNEHFVQLADVLSRLAIQYDNLFKCSFPYSMGIHQAPCVDPRESDEIMQRSIQLSHFHMHFYPPLLRNAQVRKFQVGFEMLATPQRDLTPEQASERMRDQPLVHYSQLEKDCH